MMKAKNIIEKALTGLMVAAMIAPVLAATVSFSPDLGEARFAPVDTLDAGCVSSVDVELDAVENDISSVYMDLSYVPDDLQIMRVDSDLDNLSYSIEYDTIKVDYTVPKGKSFENEKLFTVYFKSQEHVTSSLMQLTKGSHFINTKGEMIALQSQTQLKFSVVPECIPDVVPPTISLVTPQNTKQILPLDAKFVFAIRDIGKGVNKDTVKITLNGERYTADSAYMTWDNEYLTFYPKNWLPVDSDIYLTITASDVQEYGGSNILKKEFVFRTSQGVFLQNNISPDQYRAIVTKSKSTYASDVECKMLKQAYITVDSTSQEILQGVLKKLACNMSDLSDFVSLTSSDTVQASTLLATQKKDKTSVFTVLGWILFGIVFVLKVHYYLSYRKHKKLALNPVCK